MRKRISLKPSPKAKSPAKKAIQYSKTEKSSKIVSEEHLLKNGP